MAAGLAVAWWLLGMAVQWGSALIALRDRPQRPPRHEAAHFSIVAPLAGADDASPAYVDALAALSRAGAEVLVCVATQDDGAVAPLKARWREAPLLVGSSDTFNPKMNNVRKGLEAAQREIVVLCDAGVALELEDLRTAAAQLSDEVGLVLALKAATEPANFAAEMERAYLNGHQARFLLLADRIGMAVASGGVTLLANQTLQRIGNWKGFNRWIADDYSVVRSVRGLGMTTTLGNQLLRLPLGARDWPVVWRRQVRWARTRLRLPVWPVVALEPLVGAAVTGFAGAVGLSGLGAGTPLICGFVVLHLAAWLFAERMFLRGRGLDFTGAAMLAALAREALAPVLMIQALAGRTIDWRGADLGGRWRSVGVDAARRLNGS